uniref:serine-rich adhesin for platelets-like n=1 Tax=Myxine glutinosa TaxID=7769 RepID=UPI00358E47D9
MEEPVEDRESDKAGYKVATCSQKDESLPDIRHGGNEEFPENVLNNASSGTRSAQNKELKENATPSLDGAGGLSAIQHAMADPEGKATDEVTSQSSTTGGRDEEQLIAIEPRSSDRTLVSADTASVESKTVHSQSTEALLQLEPEMAQKGSGERKQSADSKSGCCLLLNWSRVRKRIETKTDKYREGEKANKRSCMPFKKKKKCPAEYSAVPLHSEGGPESLDVVAHISTENTVAMEPIKECRKKRKSRRMSNRSSPCEIFRRIFTTRGMKRDSSQTEALHRADASSAMSLKSEESRKGQDNEGQKDVFNYVGEDERPLRNDAEAVITGAIKIQKPKVDLVNLPSLDPQNVPFDVKDNSGNINQNDPVLIEVEDEQKIVSSTTVPVATEVCSRNVDPTTAATDKDNLHPVGLENKTINIIISEVNDYSDGEVDSLVNKYENNRIDVNDDPSDLQGSSIGIMAAECLNDETLGDKVICIESESLVPQSVSQENTSDANVTKYNFNTNLEEESSSEREIRVNTSSEINKMRGFTVVTHNMDVQDQPGENQQVVPAQEDENCTAQDVEQETMRDSNGTCLSEVPAAVSSHAERGVLEDDLDIDTVIGLFRDILEDIEIADIETEQSYQDISSSSPNESRDSAALNDGAADGYSCNVQAIDSSICDSDIVGPNKMGRDEERSIGDESGIHEEVEVMDKGLDVISNKMGRDEERSIGDESGIHEEVEVMDKGLDVISLKKVDAKELISAKCESGREQSFLEDEAISVKCESGREQSFLEDEAVSVKCESGQEQSFLEDETVSVKCESGREQSFLEDEAVSVKCESGQEQSFLEDEAVSVKCESGQEQSFLEDEAVSVKCESGQEQSFLEDETVSVKCESGREQSFLEDEAVSVKCESGQEQSFLEDEAVSVKCESGREQSFLEDEAESVKCESGQEQSFLENEAVSVMPSNTDEVEVEVGSACLSTSGNNAATCVPDLTKNKPYDDTDEKAVIKKPNGSMRRKRRKKNKDQKEKLKSSLDNEPRRLCIQESMDKVGNNGSTSTVTDTTAVSSISNGTGTSKSDSLSPSDEQINSPVNTVPINFGRPSANHQEQVNIATGTTKNNKSKRRRKRRRRRRSGKVKVEDVIKQCLSNERSLATGEFKTSFVAVESDTKSDSSNDVQKSVCLKAAGDTEKGTAAQIDGDKGKIRKIKRKRQSSKTDALLEEPLLGMLSIQALPAQEEDCDSLCNLVESQKDIVVPCSSETNRETSGVESEDSRSDGFQADSSRSSSYGNETITSVDHRTQEVMLNGLPNLNDNEECNPEEDNLTKIAREIISSVLSAAINQVIGKVNKAETSTPEWIFLQEDGTQSKRNDGSAPEEENDEKTCGATLEETAALIVTEAIENACRTFSTEIGGNLVDNGNASWQSTGGSSNSDDTIAEIVNHWNTESFSDNSPNDAANFPADSQSVA